MNEEEKKAVENIKELKTLFEIDDKKDFEATPLAQKEIAKDLKIVLNLIERLQKENEELKQDRNTNYQMIALAQNEMLGYMQGYEDGKKLKRSAVANIVENQQYYIFNKQIEHYKEYIVKLQKENKELKEYISIAPIEGRK